MGSPQKRPPAFVGRGGTAERMSFPHRGKRMSAACADEEQKQLDELNIICTAKEEE